MNSLGVIVGRGQSKRFPGKMLKPLHGHPLVGWTARAAAASSLSRVIISTDDPKIAEAAEAHGVPGPFLRPEHLAKDNVSNDGVLTHAVEWMQRELQLIFDIVVLIQPTAPFIRPSDIDACVTGVAEQGGGCCFTANLVSTLPEKMFRDGPQGTVEPVIPGPWLGKNKKSHPLPPTYEASGAVWALKCPSFLETGNVYSAPLSIVPIEAERSVDIDYPYDLDFAAAVADNHQFFITPPSSA